MPASMFYRTKDALNKSSSSRKRGSSCLIRLGSRLRGNDKLDLTQKCHYHPQISADFHALISDDCNTTKVNVLGEAICCLIGENLCNLRTNTFSKFNQCSPNYILLKKISKNIKKYNVLPAKMKKKKDAPLRIPVTHGLKDIYAMDMHAAYQAAYA